MRLAYHSFCGFAALLQRVRALAVRANTLTSLRARTMAGSTNSNNASGLPLSNDGWFYTNLATQMAHWRHANNCTGESRRYHTVYDGAASLWCVQEGTCTNPVLDNVSPRRTVVRCSWGGSHHVPGSGDDDDSVGTPDDWGMKLVWRFFEAHPRIAS